jgi:hypothetical protein
MSTARRIYCSTISCVLLAFAMTSATTARALQDLRSPDARDAARTPGMSETTSAPPQDLRSPDCIVLFRRLLGDRRVPRRSRLLLLALIAYLAMPFDLGPDFIPVVGQLDDAIIVALVLRTILRSGGPELVREHWPGPPTSLGVLLRVAYGRNPG